MSSDQSSIPDVEEPPSLPGDDRGAAPARSRHRRVSLAAGIAVVLALGLGAAAISRPRLQPLASSLVGVAPGWLAAACALMVLSLLVRAVAWLVVLRAAVP